jgi:hypothetical protein
MKGTLTVWSERSAGTEVELTIPHPSRTPNPPRRDTQRLRKTLSISHSKEWSSAGPFGSLFAGGRRVPSRRGTFAASILDFRRRLAGCGPVCSCGWLAERPRDAGIRDPAN